MASQVASTPPGPPKEQKIRLPGYGLGLRQRYESGEEEKGEFPVLVDDEEDGWKAATLLIREYCMLKVLENLTNKPEWWKKVFDAEIAARWKAEMLSMDWEQYHKNADFTPSMADAVSFAQKSLVAENVQLTGIQVHR